MSATDAKTTEFTLVSERGDPLQKLRMKVTDPGREFLEVMGDVQLPSVAFRLAVSGRDTKGTQYQRFYAPLFHAESVQVIPKLDLDEMSPGSSKEAVFELSPMGYSQQYSSC